MMNGKMVRCIIGMRRVLLLHDVFMEVLHLLKIGNLLLITNVGVVGSQTHEVVYQR